MLLELMKVVCIEVNKITDFSGLKINVNTEQQELWLSKLQVWQRHSVLWPREHDLRQNQELEA